MRSYSAICIEYESNGMKDLTDNEINVLTKKVSEHALEELQFRAKNRTNEPTKFIPSVSSVDSIGMLLATTDEELEEMLNQFELTCIENGWDTDDIYTPNREHDGGITAYGKFYTEATLMNDYLDRRAKLLENKG